MNALREDNGKRVERWIRNDVLASAQIQTLGCDCVQDCGLIRGRGNKAVVEVKSVQ